ncbi:SYCY2 protein, partial [Odontophorus gujanensis]|nr:SYCY2 protein [Odontophorus gujanensis]
DKYIRWYRPFLGVSELEREIVNISATLEQIENVTARALENLQVEVSSLSSVVLQNRVAPDILAAKGGVAFALINTCCALINREKEVEMDIK